MFKTLLFSDKKFVTKRFTCATRSFIDTLDYIRATFYHSQSQRFRHCVSNLKYISYVLLFSITCGVRADFVDKIELSGSKLRIGLPFMGINWYGNATKTVKLSANEVNDEIAKRQKYTEKDTSHVKTFNLNRFSLLNVSVIFEYHTPKLVYGVSSVIAISGCPWDERCSWVSVRPFFGGRIYETDKVKLVLNGGIGYMLRDVEITEGIVLGTQDSFQNTLHGIYGSLEFVCYINVIALSLEVGAVKWLKESEMPENLKNYKYLEQSQHWNTVVRCSAMIVIP